MATRKAIADALSIMHEAFPQKEITDATPELWFFWFRDEADADVLRVANQFALDRGRKFFPTPGEFVNALRPLPALDYPDLVRRIEFLGHYNPAFGWIWPRVERVCEEFGDAIAAGYSASCGRLGADDETTRSIATRDFTTEVDAVLKRDGAKALNGKQQPPMIGGATPKKLGSGGDP